MKEYKLKVRRTYTQEVIDTYTIYVDDKESLLKEVKEMFEDPVKMAMTPHDTEEDSDRKVWNEDVFVHVIGEDINIAHDNHGLVLPL